MCIKSPMASSLNPTAQPWKPTEEQNASLPSISDQIIKLPHELFPPPQPPLILAPPPPPPPPKVTTIIALPPPLQHVNNHPLSPVYVVETGLNFYSHSYYTQLQPKTFHFCTPLVSCFGHGCEKRKVAIEEMGSHGGDENFVGDAVTSPLTEMKVEKTTMVRRMKGRENLDDFYREKPGFIARFVPPRLQKPKRNHSLNGYRKKIETREIWRPKDGTPSSVHNEDDLLCTTVMIKNVPNRLRRNSLMGFLDDCCRRYQMEYDFLYLPMDFGTHDNLGYAFVNFTTAAAAMKCKEVLQGFKWEPVYGPCGLSKSKKVCEITWAKIQGKDALVRHFENSQFICNTRDYLPVVLSPSRNGSNSTVERTIGKLWSQSMSPGM